MTQRAAGDEGTTLVEVIVAVGIMGILMAAVLGGMMTSVLSSDVHRKQATGETVIRSYAETAKAYATANYSPCASTYAVSFSAPSGYTANPVTVDYRDASGTWVKVCPGGSDVVQRLTVSLKSDDERAVETAQVVVRKL